MRKTWNWRERDISNLCENNGIQPQTGAFISGLARFAVNEYRSGRRVIYRDFKAQSLMERIGQKLGIELPEIEILRSGKSALSFKALTMFTIRTLCGMSYKDKCKAVGNVSLSGCARLCAKGYELITREKTYRSIFADVSGMTLHA